MTEHPGMSRRLRTWVLASLATCLCASEAHGAAVTSTGTVTGSVLSAATSATPTFSASLDSGDQSQTYTVPLAIQDTRGTGAGWNLTVTSTTFTTGGGSPKTLATNSSTLTGVNSSCTSGTCTNPSNAQSYPINVPAAASAPTAVKFFNTTANNGMGIFTITPTVSVSIPQNAYAGTYTSTVTLSIVSGP